MGKKGNYNRFWGVLIVFSEIITKSISEGEENQG